MGKKVVAIVIFFFLLSSPLVGRAASIRKGTLLELRGGFYHPSDSDSWDTAFGRSFSGFGGLKLSQEVLKNIEIGLSADYVHAKARNWHVFYVPMGLNMTYAMRYHQDQLFVPYLGGGVDYVYGKTSGQTDTGQSGEETGPTYLNETGYHAQAGIRLLLDALSEDEASGIDQKFGVNNSYLVFEARYLKLFNSDYADQPLGGKPGTGYLDPKGMFISMGILVEF
jgi:hypothetical protein